MKKRYTDEQIIGFFKQAAACTPVKELCSKHGFSDGSFYIWRQRFGGMDVPYAILTGRCRQHRRACPVSTRAPDQSFPAQWS